MTGWVLSSSHRTPNLARIDFAQSARSGVVPFFAVLSCQGETAEMLIKAAYILAFAIPTVCTVLLVWLMTGALANHLR